MPPFLPPKDRHLLLGKRKLNIEASQRRRRPGRAEKNKEEKCSGTKLTRRRGRKKGGLEEGPRRGPNQHANAPIRHVATRPHEIKLRQPLTHASLPRSNEVQIVERRGRYGRRPIPLATGARQQCLVLVPTYRHALQPCQSQGSLPPPKPDFVFPVPFNLLERRNARIRTTRARFGSAWRRQVLDGSVCFARPLSRKRAFLRDATKIGRAAP